MRVTVPSSSFATQVAPSPIATASAPFPACTVPTTAPVRGSTRATVPLVGLVTQTEPSPTATPEALGTAAKTRARSVLRSIRLNVLSLELATQT